MAALVQSFPQQSGTVTMLHTRPTSASDMMVPNQATSQQYVTGQYRHNARSIPGNGGGATMVYRGSPAPIQPYAFTTTPGLTPSEQWQKFRQMPTRLTSEAPMSQTFDNPANPGRPCYPASVSMTNLPSTALVGIPVGGASRDDLALTRPNPVYNGASPSGSGSGPSPTTTRPERYRKTAARLEAAGGSSQHPPGQPPRTVKSGPGIATVAHVVYNSRSAPDALSRGSSGISSRPLSLIGVLPAATIETHLSGGLLDEDIKRLRRRSMPTLDVGPCTKLSASLQAKQPDSVSSSTEQETPNRASDTDPNSVRILVPVPSPDTATTGKRNGHERTESSDSLGSSHSITSDPRPSSSNRSPNIIAPVKNLVQFSSAVEQSQVRQDQPKLVNIPPRSTSSDAAAAKKAPNPSPLSQPVTKNPKLEKQSCASPVPSPSPGFPAIAKTAHAPQPASPAAKQLAAINDRGVKTKSKTSRLRRAFSFGSAAEFKKAMAPDGESTDSATANTQGKLHKEPTPGDLYDAEQARVAKRQEEAGIGSSIYSGSRFFAASTDNISISSTASSASIMIRKMGRGMKKKTRSFVGLFRPKSVTGVPESDANIPEGSQAAVSMVTVEAECQRVNVDDDPSEPNGGGAGFLRLERISIDASQAPSMLPERTGSSETETSVRKSILGGDQERAEVLAAVRKGILKHSGTPSPLSRDNKVPSFDLFNVPAIPTDSPKSSAPGTPNDEQQINKRNGSVAVGSEDYFLSALRLRQDTRSAPGTPNGVVKRNATFNPRLVFHDTWPSQEYDRRGEIATCNRLTPMLAQQIKEELNTFKMEMEVHENSKIYTHFF